MRRSDLTAAWGVVPAVLAVLCQGAAAEQAGAADAARGFRGREAS
jgi:hypothetical protein